jgi:hypothetical protein
MMAPVDLQAATRDIKARIHRAIAELEEIELQTKTEPIFATPRDVWLGITLVVHQLDAALSRMHRAWWP